MVILSSCTHLTHCGSDFEVRLAAASMLPSRQGNKGLPGDLLENLPGNVFESRPQAGTYAPGHLPSKRDEHEST